MRQLHSTNPSVLRAVPQLAQNANMLPIIYPFLLYFLHFINAITTALRGVAGFDHNLVITVRAVSYCNYDTVRLVLFSSDGARTSLPIKPKPKPTPKEMIMKSLIIAAIATIAFAASGIAPVQAEDFAVHGYQGLQYGP